MSRTERREAWEGHEGAVLDEHEARRVLACEGCGFKHVVPLPSAAELDELYRRDFYSREKPLYLERHRADAEWWDLVYGERYDTLERELGPGCRRILDVGSGPGFFLLHGKRRGWRTLGVEPSRQAAAHARELGLEIVEAFLDEPTARGLGSFDAVHLSEVLEHVPDPRALLGLVQRLLAPGGFACIAVPNDYNPFQLALRRARGFRPWWVAPRHHVNYFDGTSLARLLERSGFELVRQEATFPIELFLLMGDNYVGDDALGRACHAKRKAFEHALHEAGLGALKRELYRRLGELDLGREVVAFARKR